MILHPAIIALLVASILISLLMIYSGFWGYRILRKWDLRSGSDIQLSIERRTYLISTILNYVFVFELGSLFLYIYTADTLHTLFVGAMCAAGTLNVNKYGYPLLIFKILNFLLAGLWLIFNYVDTKAYDYPLIKKKYTLLLIIIPFILVESVLLCKYFLGLKADVITSCCGSLFGSGRSGITSDITAIPGIPMMIGYIASMVLTFASGVTFYRKEKGGYFFSFFCFLAFFIAIASIISFISVYIYELPTHHCPFCILQKEYGYIGYFLYMTLFGGVISGMGIGLLMPFRNIQSLAKKIPLTQKKLTGISLVLYGIFAATVTYKIIFSHLIVGTG